MVDFSLTDEQKDIRQLAHDFADKEIRPKAWDFDRDSTFPQEIIEKAWEVGLLVFTLVALGVGTYAVVRFLL